MILLLFLTPVKCSCNLMNLLCLLDSRTTDNETPLQLSIKCQLPDVVDSLCKRGVDMSVLDANNNCPLWMALESGQEDIAAILVR